MAGRNQTPLLASPQWVTAPTENYTKRFLFFCCFFWEEEIKSSHFTLTLKAKTTKQQNMKTNVYGDLLQVSEILLWNERRTCETSLERIKELYLNHNNENKERYKKVKDLTFVLEMSLSNKQICCRRKHWNHLNSIEKLSLNLNWNYHNVPSSNANLVTVKSFKINN